MFDAFKKWSMSGHTFKFAKLTVAEIESLGAATQQFLEQEEEGDEAATVRLERAGRRVYRDMTLGVPRPLWPGGTMTYGAGQGYTTSLVVKGVRCTLIRLVICVFRPPM